MAAANHSHVDNTHPCYQIDLVSLTVTSTPALHCDLWHLLVVVLSVVTVCGNLLVIFSTVYFTQLRTPTNFLVLSLAVSDLLVGAVIVPLSAKYPMHSCLYIQNAVCKLLESLSATLSTASILNLCCISVDRYYAVCQPLTYRAKISRKVAMAMIALSWGASVLVAMGFLISRLKFEKCQGECFYSILLANVLGPVFSFYLPTFIMVCIYLKIFLVAQRQAHSIHNPKAGAKGRKREGKATKTLAIVMGVFLLCWTPIFLCLGFQLINIAPVPIAAFESCTWLALSNSLLNPFIYAFFYSWFRSAFRLIISGKVFQGDFSNSKLL